MGKGIVKLGSKYVMWSTIVDAPLTEGMTREELREYIQDQHGRAGVADFEERMKRVEAKGTSFVDLKSVEDVIHLNRAGANEKTLTLEELIKEYKCS